MKPRLKRAANHRGLKNELVVKLLSKSDWGWIGINGLTAIAFVYFSSREWIEPELRGFPGANGGGSAVFTLLTLWFCFPLLTVNLVWLLISTRRGARAGGKTPPSRLFWLIGIGWCGLVLFSASKL